MSVKIKFDRNHNPIQPTLILSTKSGKKLGYIPAVNISITDNFNEPFDLEFQVYKETDGVKYCRWDYLKECKEWDIWFEMYVNVKESSDVMKTITCKSIGEAELSNINLYNIYINTEEDIQRDDFKPTVLYNPNDKSSSLLDRLLQKVPHYKVGHVDDSIKGIQRTFSFDGKSIMDAFYEVGEEIQCIFKIDSGSDENGKISRTVNVYDLQDYCMDCGTRGSFSDECDKCNGNNIIHGYGDDTTIFINTENIADEISMTTDTNSVKNCFRLEAGDDIMTASVISCNPNGSQYIWYITDDMKEDMSDELRSKLDEYDELYRYYNEDFEPEIPASLVSSYNSLIDKYREFDSSLQHIDTSQKGFSGLSNLYFDTVDLYLLINNTLMPSVETDKTSASAQAALLTSAKLSPTAVEKLSTASLTTVNNAVLFCAKTIVDNRFQVKIKSSSMQDNIWKGTFTVTSYYDEEDVADSALCTVEINDDRETYIKQRIDNILKNADNDNVSDVVSLFSLSSTRFASEIKKFCLSSLNTFNKAATACLNLLTEQGVGTPNKLDGTTNDLHDSLYKPYYDKMIMLQQEIAIKESDVETITGKRDELNRPITDGMQTFIEDKQEEVRNILNFEQYLGKDLWLELTSYRREDTYSNSNYISDGLTNAEIFDNARLFYEEAKKELFKSATLQHSIRANLKNLLTIEGFEPITEYFKTGNWIRARIDGVICKLRLLSYSINFEDLDYIDVEFSDVTKFADTFSDIDSVLSSAKSMSSTYGYVSRQSALGKKSSDQMDIWVNNGMALTKMKIVDDASNQNITWDSNGMLFREFMPYSDDYSPKQAKIINKGIYFTEDDWLTSKSAVGDFLYYNPKTGEYEEGYGVIADTIVGNVILGKDVGIYNTSGSMTMDENGLVVTASSGQQDNDIFTVRRVDVDEYGDNVYRNLMYINSNGELVINGEVRFNSGDDSMSVEGILKGENIGNAIDEKIEANNKEYVGSSIDKATQKVQSDLSEALENYQSVVGSWLDFGTDGLHIGAKDPITGDDSPFQTLITNTAMTFTDNGVPVAQISNQSLLITDAIINNALYIGNFIYVPRNNGSVSISWQERTDEPIMAMMEGDDF